MRRMRWCGRAALIMVLALLLVGCSGSDDEAAGPDPTEDPSPVSAESPSEEVSDPAAENAELQAWIEGAREEGSLVLNWGHNGIPESMELWQEAFNEEFGLDVTIEYNPSPSMPDNFASVVQEVQSGRATSTDVFVGSVQFATLGGTQEQDVFEVVDWAAIAPDWPEGVAAFDGSSVTLLHQILGFAYNTDVLDESELPQTVADVVELASTQPVASTPYAAGFTNLAVDELLGPDATVEHVTAFGEVVDGLIGCSDVDRIASGEFVGFWMNCGKNIIDTARETRGAPIDTVVLRDAAITQPWMMGVPKTASNSNTAKLFVYWLQTREAQDILFANTFADNRLLDGSGTGEQIAAREADGIEFVHFDYQKALDEPLAFDREFTGRLIAALTGR